jgi:hypothetical protein
VDELDDDRDLDEEERDEDFRAEVFEEETRISVDLGRDLSQDIDEPETVVEDGPGDEEMREEIDQEAQEPREPGEEGGEGEESRDRPRRGRRRGRRGRRNDERDERPKRGREEERVAAARGEDDAMEDADLSEGPDDALARDLEDDDAEGATIPPMDDDDDDEEVDKLTDLNVPSWNDLIASLYRPER